MQDTSKSWQTKSPIKHNIRYDFNNCVYCCIFLMIVIARLGRLPHEPRFLCTGFGHRRRSSKCWCFACDMNPRKSCAARWEVSVVKRGTNFPWRIHPWCIYLHEWLVSMAIHVGKYNIHGSNVLINVTSVKRSKIWNNAVFFWECLETFFLFPVPMSCVFGFQHADRSNAKPCPGTTFRGVDLLVNLRFRIHTGELASPGFRTQSIWIKGWLMLIVRRFFILFVAVIGQGTLISHVLWHFW